MTDFSACYCNTLITICETYFHSDFELKNSSVDTTTTRNYQGAPQTFAKLVHLGPMDMRSPADQPLHFVLALLALSNSDLYAEVAEGMTPVLCTEKNKKQGSIPGFSVPEGTHH